LQLAYLIHRNLQFMNLHRKTIKAYTLVEVLIYVGLTSTLMIVIVSLVTFLLQNRVKSQTINEVESQGTILMQQITKMISNARGIDSPASGTSANSLTLDVYNSSNDPTVIFLNGSELQITEGVQAPITLTSNKVSLNQVSFTNSGAATTNGSVKITFTLSYNNPGNLQEFNYQQIFYGSASINYQ